MSLFPVPSYKIALTGLSGIASVVLIIVSNAWRFGNAGYKDTYKNAIPRTMLAAAILQLVLLLVLTQRSRMKMYKKWFPGPVVNTVLDLHIKLPNFIVTFNWLVYLSFKHVLPVEKKSALVTLTFAMIASQVFSAAVEVMLFVNTAAYDRMATKGLKLVQSSADEEASGNE